MRAFSLLLVGLSLSACGSPRHHVGAAFADADAALDASFDAGPDKPPTSHLPVGPACGSAGVVSWDAGLGASNGAQPELDAALLPGDAASASGATDPAAAQTPTRVGELVITELMIDPASTSDTTGEWVELYNASSAKLTLRECVLADQAQKPHMLAGELVVAAGAYATIARSLHAGFVPGTTAAFSLANTAGRLALACRGIEIDSVAYDKAQGFSVAKGASLQLDPAQLDAASNDHASAWCLATQSYGPELGTPGRRNSGCSDSDGGALAP